MNTLFKLLTLGVVLAGLSFAGSVDLQTELDEAARYKENVCAGYWPNYKEIQLICE